MKQKDIICSGSNSQVKNIGLLIKKAKEREKQGVFIVEGIKMLDESRTLGVLQKAYCSETFYQKKLADNSDYFTGLDYEILTDAIFNQVSETKTPQGILGLVKVEEHSLETILCHENSSVMILEDIRDPGNLGTIIRTAEGAGMTGIILNSTSVDLYHPKVIRSTMGSIYRMPIVVVEDLKGTILKLKSHGVCIFAAHLSGKTYDAEVGFLGKTGILIGNEANGLSDEISKLADSLIKIPMEGQVESLNAAIAAAILMYEIHRQRQTKV